MAIKETISFDSTPDSIPTDEMIRAGLSEWFADAWGERDEDRMTRVFLAMEKCRPK
jgi:hypothetical protein